jgi:transposase
VGKNAEASKIEPNNVSRKSEKMNRSTLEKALGLPEPWMVTKDEFNLQEQRLDITIDFKKGSLFPCPECSVESKVHDAKEKTWRHLNFFQHETYIHARVPRVECSRCGTKTVEVPWARPRSGFTLLFEALIMTLVREMPVAAIAALIKEHDTRIWRVLHHYVEEARQKADYSEVKRIGMDETASSRGHHYITLFIDLDEKRLLFGTEGRDQCVVRTFSRDLQAHGGNPAQIRQVCSDMWPAYIKGVKDCFPEAEITFDRFHIMKIMNAAVDQVRREEAKTRGELKSTRYLWLKNPSKLTAKQKQAMEKMPTHNLKTARAYQIRLTFQELFAQPTRKAGEAFLKRWYYWATHSRLDPIIAAAKTIKKHWEGILNWFDSMISTGILEGYNSLIQAAKSRARGYRTIRNLITMAYLVAGKLDFALPT